jgi:hypothetical protein
MSRFKAGDKVRAVDEDLDGVENGKVYTVDSVRDDDGCLILSEILEAHPLHARFSWRYELVQPTNAYTVHNETFGGCYCGSFFTIAEATTWIQDDGASGETYTIRETIERRKFEVVEKVQRELKAI